MRAYTLPFLLAYLDQLVTVEIFPVAPNSDVDCRARIIRNVERRPRQRQVISINRLPVVVRDERIGDQLNRVTRELMLH